MAIPIKWTGTIPLPSDPLVGIKMMALRKYKWIEICAANLIRLNNIPGWDLSEIKILDHTNVIQAYWSSLQTSPSDLYYPLSWDWINDNSHFLLDQNGSAATHRINYIVDPKPVVTAAWLTWLATNPMAGYDATWLDDIWDYDTLKGKTGITSLQDYTATQYETALYNHIFAITKYCIANGIKCYSGNVGDYNSGISAWHTRIRNCLSGVSYEGINYYGGGSGNFETEAEFSGTLGRARALYNDQMDTHWSEYVPYVTGALASQSTETALAAYYIGIKTLDTVFFCNMQSIDWFDWQDCFDISLGDPVSANIVQNISGLYYREYENGMVYLNRTNNPISVYGIPAMTRGNGKHYRCACTIPAKSGWVMGYE